MKGTCGPLATPIDTGTGARPDAVEKATAVGFTTNCCATMTFNVTDTVVGVPPPAGVKVRVPG